MYKRILGFSVFVSGFFLPIPAFAHEAYVLTHNQFSQGLLENTKYPLAALLDPHYIGVSAFITLCVFIGYTLALLWATTPWAGMLDKAIKQARVIGPLIIRVAISTSFFFAAMTNCVLGPELSLTNVPGGITVRFLLFVLSIMIFFGTFVELAACIGLMLFFYTALFYGLYMVTYANYFGELIVLLLFGSRTLSFDQLLFGKKLLFEKLEQYTSLETPIVRMLYGIALMFAGYTIKFQHQSLSIAVYNEYHLKNFFHAQAAFIAAGAGLSEIAIGLFIFLGFAQRLTILISLTFITLSLLYFREMLWPHLMLYGISFSLIINAGDEFTLDRYLIPWIRETMQKLLKH